jgi:ABC-type uncharacterized transport system substrate-binding protein
LTRFLHHCLERQVASEGEDTHSHVEKLDTFASTSVTQAGLEAKRLELLHELIPNARTIAMLVNPSYPDLQTQLRRAQEAARAFGQQLIVLKTASESDFDPTFTTLTQQRADALLVASDPFFISRRHRLVALTARQAVFVINLKAAKSLDLTLPPTLLARADEVIE